MDGARVADLWLPPAWSAGRPPSWQDTALLGADPALSAAGAANLFDIATFTLSSMPGRMRCVTRDSDSTHHPGCFV